MRFIIILSVLLVTGLPSYACDFFAAQLAVVKTNGKPKKIPRFPQRYVARAAVEQAIAGLGWEVTAWPKKGQPWNQAWVRIYHRDSGTENAFQPRDRSKRLEIDQPTANRIIEAVEEVRDIELGT